MKQDNNFRKILDEVIRNSKEMHERKSSESNNKLLFDLQGIHCVFNTKRFNIK